MGCKDHLIKEETLPQPVIDFAYEVADPTYRLDFYAGCTVRFYPTVPLSTDCRWEISDGRVFTGDTVVCEFPVAGNFYVTATANGGKKINPIQIAAIRPILRLVQADSICVVDSSYVAFDVELPNPKGFDAEYKWTFANVMNEDGQVLTEFIGTDKELGKIKFTSSGSQRVRLDVTFIDTTGNRQALDAVSRNVQVALKEAAPTLYYAVKDGNILARKLTDVDNAQPYDMGISSGQHPFNILFDHSSNALLILDAGKQFIYVNDENGVLGDGKISVMAADASSLGVMISNVGGPAFQDPFYGCIDGNYIYYSDRNTGIFRLPLTTRNATWNKDEYPYYVQNAQLGYYSRGLSYGAITGCFGKVEGTWYWSKTYNGQGIFRFLDSDILKDANSYSDAKAPTAGILLKEMFYPKAFAYDSKNKMFYFSIYGTGTGVYKIPFADIENLQTVGSANDLKVYMMDADVTIEPVTEQGKNEGSSGEFIGICQMAVDEATGDVYFGYRPDKSNEDALPSGLYRYNAATQKLSVVDDTKGLEIYGVSIKQTPTQLF